MFWADGIFSNIADEKIEIIKDSLDLPEGSQDGIRGINHKGEYGYECRKHF